MPDRLERARAARQDAAKQGDTEAFVAARARERFLTETYFNPTVHPRDRGGRFSRSGIIRAVKKLAPEFGERGSHVDDFPLKGGSRTGLYGGPVTAHAVRYNSGVTTKLTPKAGTEAPDYSGHKLHELARVIHRDWSKQGKGVNFAAKPYLDAMGSLEHTKDMYGADTGSSIVSYFIGNAGTWKGPVAKAVKAELRKRVKR